MKRQNEKSVCGQFEFRQHSGISDNDGRNAARTAEQNCFGWHEKEMAKLAADSTGQIEVKEMSLAEDQFKIAAEEIQNQHVAEQVPRPIVQKHGGKKLPCIRI